MDTLVISSCGRYVIHIRYLHKHDGIWMLLIGKRHRKYKSQKYAIRKAKQIIRDYRERNPLPKKKIRKRTIPVLKKDIKNVWTQVRYYDQKY